MQTLTHIEAFQFLTKEQLRKQASAAFTGKLADRVLKNYRDVWTPDLLRDNKGFQKHFIHLRNPDHYVGSFDKIEMVPEILLVNSYDARSSFRLSLIMHKVDTGSGLIASCDEKISHREVGEEGSRLSTKDTEIAIRNIIYKKIPKTLESIERLKRIQLDRFQQKQLALELCRDRWDYKYQLAHPEHLTKPSVDEDIADSSAWTVYCRIHEKVLKGGWIGAGDRIIKPLKDPNRELKVNTKMYDTILHFVSKIK
jgi:hypothetical protein